MNLRILFILIILIPLPFSCEDKNECLDLYVDPYYEILSIGFESVMEHSLTKGEFPNYRPISQDYTNTVYACDSLALIIEATDMRFFSQYNPTPGFGFIEEAFACNSNRAGYMGTKDMIDKIWVSSNYDFDETHGKDDNLSDIIEIFDYSSNELMWLDAYNNSTTKPAPKRFYLLINRKATKSNIQQFVIKYYMKSTDGSAPKHFEVTTPLFHVK